MPNNLITIYITNYNYGSYIEQAINSVLSQTVSNFELLIIDDGSTDNSSEIIEGYRNNPKVQIIYQQNKGLNITNNIALRLAQGNYIMRLDADDYLEENALELLSNELDVDAELGLVFPDYFIVDKGGELIERHHRHDFKKEVSLYDQAAHGACTMIRVDFLRALGGYNENYKCQDGYELWVKFIRNYKVKNLNVPLFSYRQHGSNLTSNENRILGTRAQINADFIVNNEINVDAIAIIPIRSLDDKFIKIEVKGESLLNIKIGQALSAKNIKKVVLSCTDEQILGLVKDTYRNDAQFVFHNRSQESIRYNQSLALTVTEVFEALQVENENFEAAVLLDIRFPMISSININDAINTLQLFNSDSLISVRNFPNMIFQHDGSGMKPVLEQDKFTKLEREQLYEHVGGITVVRNSSFIESKSIVHGKVGHIILDKKSSIGIEGATDLKIVESLF